MLDYYRMYVWYDMCAVLFGRELHWLVSNRNRSLRNDSIDFCKCFKFVYFPEFTFLSFSSMYYFLALDGSSILNSQEREAVSELQSYSNSLLLYRASDNTFSSQTYYSLISGRTKVLTIYRVKNYVFGSYIHIANPYPNIAWQKDSNAFLFSLRRNGTSNAVKFSIIESDYAFYSHYSYMAYNGRADLYVANQPFSNTGSSSNLGLSYSAPSGCTYNSVCAYTFLAGAYSGWYVDEIEAYQLS